MSDIRLCRLWKSIERDSFFFSNLVFGSSKWRMSRLTRGCADNDIYSMGWALSWTRMRQRGRRIVDRSEEEDYVITSCINFLQTGRISLDSVALNIMTCLLCGVLLNISCTSRRISVTTMINNEMLFKIKYSKFK